MGNLRSFQGSLIGNMNTPQGIDGNNQGSGRWRMSDQLLLIQKEQWPLVKKHVSCTESTSTVTEGTSMSFAIVTEGYSTGNLLYYTINTVSGTTMDAADFGGVAIAASFALTNNAATLNFSLTAEITPGDAESNTFKLEIRTGSTGGPVVMESGVVTVTDTIAYGTDIRTAFYEISNRFLNSQTYMGNSSDYNGPYDVGEVTQGYSGTVRVYLAHKVTASTTFYNDTPVAAVVHLNGSNTIQNSWIFHAGTTTWQTKTAHVTGTSALMSTLITPLMASGYSYSNLTTSVGTAKWGLRSSTGSSYTGAAGGIASGTTSFPVGDAQIAQVGASNYAFRECSGSTRWSSVFMRSPSITIASGDKLRVVHALTGQTQMASTIDPDDSIWIGVY